MYFFMNVDGSNLQLLMTLQAKTVIFEIIFELIFDGF